MPLKLIDNTISLSKLGVEVISFTNKNMKILIVIVFYRFNGLKQFKNYQTIMKVIGYIKYDSCVISNHFLTFEIEWCSALNCTINQR